MEFRNLNLVTVLVILIVVTVAGTGIWYYRHLKRKKADLACLEKKSEAAKDVQDTSGSRPFDETSGE